MLLDKPWEDDLWEQDEAPWEDPWELGIAELLLDDHEYGYRLLLRGDGWLGWCGLPCCAWLRLHGLGVVRL